jgi:small subunit ribosomal protein S6
MRLSHAQAWLTFRPWRAIRQYPGAIPRKGGIPMRDYELVFIVHPDLDETALHEVVEKVKGWITETGGTIDKVDFWGKRRLAYAIRKQKEGQYVLIRTQLDPTTCIQLERNLRFQEPVMRFLLTSVES